MKTTMTRAGIAGTIDDYRRYRRTIRELSRLSDRDLSDMGIPRVDICATARASAYQR
jgi:uncharacterized protein YjiS (DUF1127 family)